MLFLTAAAFNFSPSMEVLAENPFFTLGCLLIVASLLNSVYIILKQRKSTKKGTLFLVLLHFGLLILVVGEFLNLHFGESLLLYVKEGMRVDKAFAADEKVVDLPFSIELKDFYPETNDGNSKVSNYISNIIITDSRDNSVFKTFVSVNNPVFYGGWYIYQYDAGIDSVENSYIEVELEIDGRQLNLNMQFEKKVRLPNGAVIKISDFAPAVFKRRENNGIYVQKTEIMTNPAYLIEYVTRDNKSTTQWIWAKDGQSDIGDIKICIVGHQNIEYSVFSVTSKPFRHCSYLGMVLASIGLCCFTFCKFSIRNVV